MTSEVTQAALEPCPFCGGEAEIQIDHGRNRLGVGCTKCACNFHAQWHGAEAEKLAISDWNTRLTAQSGEGRSGAGEDALPDLPWLSGPDADQGRSALESALAKRTSMSTVAGGGQRPHVEIRFSELADAHALTDAILNRSSALNARQSGEGEREALRIIKAWLDWYRFATGDDDCQYLNGKGWEDAEALASTSMGFLSAAPEAESLPCDVVRLVIAAREIAFNDWDGDSEEWAVARKELDDASEAFASRVPWEDE